jgi:hypothetical protein
MIGFLKNALWDIRDPWPHSAIEGRVRDVQIKIYDEAEFDECPGTQRASLILPAKAF